MKKIFKLLGLVSTLTLSAIPFVASTKKVEYIQHATVFPLNDNIKEKKKKLAKLNEMT